MSNEEFRRELNNVFDNVSGSPSSNLPDRVRSAIVNPPEARGPYWLAAVAAAVVAVLIIGVLYVAGPLKPLSPVGGVHPTPSPSTSASPSIQPTPTASPSPSAQPFVCTNQNSSTTPNGRPPLSAYIDALRTGSHTGYDRLTVEFANGAPASVQLSVQSGTTFTKSPSGMETTLKGKNGILVVIRGADLHTSYSGSTDIVTGYSGLAEVKQVEDFEGVVQLGLGVNGAACYHVQWLTNPDRLVIDIQNS